MPELPEVQTIAAALAGLIVEQTIVGVGVRWPGVVDRPDVATFIAALRGRRVTAVSRRGKYLQCALDNGRWLLFHLRMTGEMRVLPATAALDPHEHLVLHLENGLDWRFKDTRKFGRAYLVADPTEVVGKLGPEPLDPAFTPAYLAQALAGRKAPIKSLLLDQRLVAGLGNIYADEALFRARIHPLRPGGNLTSAEIAGLVEAIREVIAQAVADMGTTLRDYHRPDGSVGRFQNRLQVFRRQGQPCPLCGAPIERIVVGGRSTHFCANDQKMG
ncbi:MAG: bifunctional DNA-formamidopyrimidine glycosylase/DNA-(apurinic or apyrimidinic site) lyase [Anaerolineae bacterium]|nr:bifunctional DNA-formamidopyrimidine glycosylase/DNA-(apurinic or apyrimidinic site) lyase [Caldilineales bacterium]MDW8269659.1 bifunctional DNA-formamidopyrimidine glycosylase/DNA-(apurinic or apyrimidinic site) lyase [Anaerolineae bacterium]